MGHSDIWADAINECGDISNLWRFRAAVRLAEGRALWERRMEQQSQGKGGTMACLSCRALTWVTVVDGWYVCDTCGTARRGTDDPGATGGHEECK
jgi:hypothetical protein